MKKLSIFLTLLFVVLSGSAKAAEGNGCYITFYQTKDMKCVDALLEELRKEPPANEKRSDPHGVIGFFAQLFSTDPQKKEQFLKQENSSYIQFIYVVALNGAGLPEEAAKYADAHGWSKVKNAKEVKIPPLKSMKSISNPGYNDVLIGAYMASGDVNYIKSIVENYTSADDTMVKDAMRLALMQSKFGTRLTPPERKDTVATTICQKYNCKVDSSKLMRVMTLSTAFWALSSLAKNDEGIKKTLIDFFEGDSRLKQALITEKTAFSNYLTMLMAYTAVKNNPGINSSLSIYEQFGSAEAAVNAVKNGAGTKKD